MAPVPSIEVEKEIRQVPGMSTVITSMFRMVCRPRKRIWDTETMSLYLYCLPPQPLAAMPHKIMYSLTSTNR